MPLRCIGLYSSGRGATSMLEGREDPQGRGPPEAAMSNNRDDSVPPRGTCGESSVQGTYLDRDARDPPAERVKDPIGFRVRIVTSNRLSSERIHIIEGC